MTRAVLLLLLVLCQTAPAPLLAHAPCRTEGRGLPGIQLKEVARGLRNPVHLTHAGDGSGRLFVVEQRGVIRVIDKGVILDQPFLDIRKRVVSGGERGLLSLAFHPDYPRNGFVYVNYTANDGGLHTVVSRFRRRNHNRLDADSETRLLTVDQPYSNHNGGQIAFGFDGYLYIGMGDGGSANDPLNHGQNPNTLLGALLRIDINRTQAPLAYAIPKDNPFVGKAGHRPEIWAFGLRNPWRFSFDAVAGHLYAADVGQNRVEEINVIKRGRNYGWRIMEGDICTPGVNRDCRRQGLELPVATYRHPAGFSVTGGFAYRGSEIPGLCGFYLYSDYVTPVVRALRYDGRRVTATRTLYTGNRQNFSSFGEDEQHELYLLDHRAGKVSKIVAGG